MIFPENSPRFLQEFLRDSSRNLSGNSSGIPPGISPPGCLQEFLRDLYGIPPGFLLKITKVYAEVCFWNTSRSFLLDFTRDFSAICSGIPPGISPKTKLQNFVLDLHQENIQDFLGLPSGMPRRISQRMFGQTAASAGCIVGAKLFHHYLHMNTLQITVVYFSL